MDTFLYGMEKHESFVEGSCRQKMSHSITQSTSLMIRLDSLEIRCEMYAISSRK